jgi:type VII secretion protein EccB
MPSRQDQLHSYQFMVQRVVAALVMRDTDPAQSPFRRLASATLAGVVVAALGLAGAAVYGVFRGGSAEGWQDANAVIIERESGAKYVYRDNKLHPVLNYASALLIVGSATPNVMTVSRNKLANVPRGTAYGIPKAPDALPDKANLQRPPWTVCSLPDTTTGRGNGTRSVLSVQRRPEAGRALDDGKALLVSAPDGEVYLIWKSHSYHIHDREVVLPALAWNAQNRAPVATALLNTLQAGADIARVQLPAPRGEKSLATRTAKVGQVYRIETLGGARLFAVALPAGLAEITQVLADLLLGDPDTAPVLGQREAIPLGQAEYTAAPKARWSLPSGDMAPPATSPTLVAPASGTVLCAQVAAGGAAAQVRVDVPPPDVAGATTTGSRTAQGTVLADRILVPPNSGAVIEALASPSAPGGALSIVTDLGIRYPVPSPEVLAMLGYAGVTPVRVPAELVALFPVGPALDPSAAQQPVAG